MGVLSTFYIISCDSGDNSNNGQVPNPTPSPTPDPEIENQFSLTNAFPSLIFDRPLDIQNSGDSTNRLFVVEQKGVIKVIDNLGSGNQVQAEVNGLDATSEIFLDIQERVEFDENELGLLGLAFHPDYENNGLFYINYIAGSPLRTIVSEFSRSSDDPNKADPNSEVVLLEIPQPHTFHNGGQLVFGPNDGYLYISIGDGGDVLVAQRSQDLTNLFGTVLRIEVDNSENQLNYAIPFDNPFINNLEGFREEIYAYGLGNPWRLAFDPFLGKLLAGDVGRFAREEINLIEKGKNYGWPIMEGNLCFNPPMGCNTMGLEPPLHEYARDQGGAVIGEIIYHGNEFTELSGLYIYGDFVSGRVWALEHNGTSKVDNTQLLQFDPFSIVAFGLDEQNEPYLASFDGNIYRLERL